MTKKMNPQQVLNSLTWEFGRRAIDELAGKRVIFVGDECMGYYAELPADMTEDSAIDDFVRTYDFAPFPEDAPRDRAEQEEMLRNQISVEVFEVFEPEAAA